MGDAKPYCAICKTRPDDPGEIILSSKDGCDHVCAGCVARARLSQPCPKCAAVRDRAERGIEGLRWATGLPQRRDLMVTHQKYLDIIKAPQDKEES